MDANTILRDSEDKMKKTLDVTQGNFAQVRTGRANPAMVDHIRVDYYGTMTPLKQIANITVPEARLMFIQPWDAGALKAIEKAIGESDLGIAPVTDGKMIRLAIPPLTRERREELVKAVHKLAEEGRVAIRSVRRESNDKLKVVEKDKKITEDESRKSQESIQKLTDKYIGLIDSAQAAKEKELLQN